MKWTGNPWSATRVASSVYSICFSTALSCASWRSDRENFWGSWTLRRRERSSDPVTAEVSGSTGRSEEHTSELQSRGQLVCRLLLEKKKTSTSGLNGLLVRQWRGAVLC